MKHLNKLLWIIALVMTMSFLSPTQTKAQTTIDLYSYDSTWILCPTPITATTYGYGQTTGYNYLTDSMDMHIYFGDGSDSLYTIPLYDAGSYQYFYSNMINHIYYLPGSFTITTIATGPDGNADTTTYVFACGNACGNVTGQAYVDNNSNCIFDTGDDTLKYHPVIIYDASLTYHSTYYTDATGQYFFTLPSGLNFTIELDLVSTSGINPTCPTSGSYAFTSTSGTSVYDFGNVCSSGFNLATGGAGWGFIPGQIGYVWATVSNLFCTPVSGTLTLTLDPLVSYVGSTWIAPTTISGSTITWDFTSLGFNYSAWWWYGFWSGIHVLTSPSAIIGVSACFTITATPTVGDLDIANNTYTFCLPILSSYDPNMKEVSPAGIGATGNVAPNTEFTYTVHFQNTGTYQAFDINIIDTLDNDLDMTTFQLLGSSHPMTPSITNGNILKNDFININLPDSATNEPLSHGWFKYKIKTKAGLSNGTTIENTAHIFFDYNPAIITNTTLNTIDISLGVTDVVNTTNNGIQIYPNPSSTNVTIKVDESINGTIMIIDATGKLVMTSALNGNSSTINIEHLPSGIYQVIIPGNNTLTTRFQKIK